MPHPPWKRRSLERHAWGRHDSGRHASGRRPQSWYGPQWGPQWGPPPRRRKRWGLRRRLTFAFAFVAFAAVSLTAFLTIGAVFEAQQELFTEPFQRGNVYGWEDFAPARAAFRQITRTAFFAGLLSFFLASATAAVLTRALTRPLSALTDGARRLGAGERGLRLRVPRPRDELQTLTEAFNGLVAGLEQQEAWRRNLVADIAHDLRTPLAVMRSELEALQDGVIPVDDAALGRLHAEVLTLAKLVGSLRELSLAEGGGLPLKLETLPLATFLERLCRTFQARAAGVGVTLTLADTDPKLTATFDPDQLGRVVSNLLDNALRYAAPGPVELGAARVGNGVDQNGVEMWVRDRGPGLPGDPERLFERFYRGDSSRTRDDAGEKGSGLGLSIARAIVQAHGGTLSAENAPDGGAVFTVTLPGASV